MNSIADVLQSRCIFQHFVVFLTQMMQLDRSFVGEAVRTTFAAGSFVGKKWHSYLRALIGAGVGDSHCVHVGW